MDLVDQLCAVTRCLDAHGVPYALCGGLALAVHGAPRATTDIDLIVPEDQVHDALESMTSLGFSFRAAPMDFPDGMRIRRISRVHGTETLTVDFIVCTEHVREAFEAREQHTLRGAPLWVLDRDGLIAMKTWAGRPQDLADIARLTADDR